MKNITIIPMAEEHISAIAELEKSCFSDPWSENSIRSELHNVLSLWLVAVSDGTLVGYIGSQSAAGESDMMNVAVSPDYRNHGVATALIDALIGELKKRDMDALTLEVRESNTSAINLYEKLGFTTVGVRPNYYFHPREHALIMRKELKKHENSSD